MVSYHLFARNIKHVHNDSQEVKLSLGEPTVQPHSRLSSNQGLLLK